MEENTLPPPTRFFLEPTSKGIYVLLLKGEGCRLTVGSLGERVFSPGWYGYIGSAQGSGGFARVRRHRILSLQRDRSPRWHIDYLLLDPRFRLRYVLCGPTGEDGECLLAGRIGPPAVAGFGCSDCHCPSHLFYRTADPRREVMNAMEELGIPVVIKTINNPGR
jgi:Uri superfamily endonuclease